MRSLFRPGSTATAAALAAGILLCAPAAHAASASQRVTVSAHILSFLRLTVRSALASFPLTRAQASEGQATIADALCIEVASNKPSYALQFDIVDPQALEVVVDGLDTAVRVGPAGRSVRVAGGARRSLRTLSYHVRYAPGIAPGPRPMPVRISLQES
jgi:hypothetical protein